MSINISSNWIVFDSKNRQFMRSVFDLAIDIGNIISRAPEIPSSDGICMESREISGRLSYVIFDTWIFAALLLSNISRGLERFSSNV